MIVMEGAPEASIAAVSARRYDEIMKRLSSALGLVVLALLVAACPSPAPPPPAPGGVQPAATPVWKPKSFARAADQGCTQVWTCDCSAAPARAGCHAEPTPDDRTTGVCAADSGPANGCTRCMALPPAVTCACKDVCP
ncbi:Hypothetical protein A7982_01707 [Minicystis rosea]|nr:Hypothetical protein A7982_01707 [Minicystis rosea]